MQHLHGLGLKYNSISSVELVKLCPLIGQMVNITTLDLSNNMISLAGEHMDTCNTFGQTLAKLINLVRLDLSSNILRGKLRVVISNIVLPLRYLGLESCGMTSVDLAFLSSSQHATSLEELLLSNNNLRTSMPVFIGLLKKLKDTVQHLEVENCSFGDHNSLLLHNVFQELTQLVYLNVKFNAFREENHLLLGQAVGKLPKLQFVTVSFPRECYEGDLEEADQEAMKNAFMDKLGEIVCKKQSKLGLPNREMNVVFSELEFHMM